jgi:hypothetical protein
MTDIPTYLEVGEYPTDYQVETYDHVSTKSHGYLLLFFPHSLIILCTKTCMFTTNMKYFFINVNFFL